MSIETKIDGSPTSVTAAAQWLDGLAKALAAAGDHSAAATRLSAAAWKGDAADAYCSAGKKVTQATDGAHESTHSAAATAHAYSGELARAQRAMAELRRTAVAAGLTVNGTVIETPLSAPAVEDLPAGASTVQAQQWQARMDAHDAAAAKIQAYNSLTTQVAEQHAAHAAWVQANLVPLEAKVAEKSALSDYIDHLVTADNSTSAVGGFVEATGSILVRRGTRLQGAARAEAALRAAARSGNPAVRAGAVAPREASVLKTMERSPKLAGLAAEGGTLAETGSGMSKVGGFLGKWGGPIVAVGLGAYDISQGKSPSQVIVETGVSVGVGFAVGAAATALAGGAIVGAPVIAVGLAGAVIATGAAMGAGWLYDHYVSQGTRDKIDQGLKDAGHAVADAASDAGHAVADAASDAGHAVADAASGAWHSVFG